MLRYLIQVVHTSLTTAILTALLFAVIFKKGDPGRKKWLAAGSIAGVVASAILAVLRRTTALINRGFFNTWTLSIAIIGGIVFILLLWGVLEKSFPKLHRRTMDCAGAVLTASLFFYVLPTLFLYPTEFLLAGESVFSTDFLFKIIGFFAGLGIVLITALALFNAGTVLPDKLLRLFLTLGLVINMVNQLSAIIQFLFARRIIPMVRWVFRIIVVTINNNVFFLYAIMAIAFFLPVFLFVKSFYPNQNYSNPAEHRKIRSAMRRNRRWSIAVVLGFGVSLTTLTAVKSYAEQGVTLSPAEPMSIVGEEIIIPIDQVSDGHLHRFAFNTSDNTEVRFIVIRKNEIAYGVGLDACDICGATGYYERKGQVICRLCDVVMNISTIGFKGGCNPVPLAYALRGGTMVVSTGDLENEKGRFK
ncbi:putative membrane protein [Treponema primitia ZAS-2]|uniref:Putative membrane protein n=1 Tax=Treponema primitia (strain ATCC BAA-887 / DSM 12427 / ZAS-2) TaxID=545694 RepID=F5YQ48_TREPZ|nr:Fe-S-containing protein [Treponema primitia]AEF84786.1 putative membrane protein [Treponema primitia ZAS-2]